uniref:RNA-binding protein Musashi isogeny 2 n=1 Tax=Cajanus cajan TaxID=3821 RepID=A0A151T6I0_CAJCA|nr:RNA-binding protein Musashi isogeny 2 [Cajanus cajan]
MEMDPGKLFIGGISWDTNEDRLRQYFQNFGDVVEAVIMKDRITGRARGFGFIVFADPSVAERVVMEKHVIDGRTVEAKKAVPRDDQNVLNRSNSSSHGSPGPTPTRTKKIFVGGLASTVTESDFKKYFDQFGTITDVVVMYDHNTQRPRGFGFITYDSEEGVEKVLHKTFHELNGKMVEVKRAIPKELSPGPSRGQLGGYVYGISRVSNFPNGCIQGYNPNLVGGNGLRIDGLNFEPQLSQNESANFTSNFVLGRALNSYSASPSRYNNAIGYAGSSVGNNSTISSTNQNLWGNGNLNYATNPTSSDAFVGYGVGYGKGSESIAASASSFALSNGSYDEAYKDSYETGPFYQDHTWRSSASELEDSDSLGFGLENVVSDLMSKSSGDHIRAYAVAANRQSNRGRMHHFYHNFKTKELLFKVLYPPWQS